jgi:hypothetical protein
MQNGRRVDSGIMPQSAYALSDFTYYIFKYQQQVQALGWANLLNVFDNVKGWPFPN